MNRMDFEMKLKLMTEVDMIAIGNSVCSICLNSYAKGAEVVLLCCNHFFHFACIDSWFEEYDHQKSNCPYCKREIDRRKLLDER